MEVVDFYVMILFQIAFTILLADHNNIVRYPVMSVSKEDIIQIALREHEDTSGLSDWPVTFAHAHIVYRHTAG